MCGLIVSQYRPGSGVTNHRSTYVLVCSQTILSAVTAVYNEHLNRSSNASLHAQNMVLYACGTVINLVTYLLLGIFTKDETGFFSGYDSWGAIMFILSNVCIGLAVTAVYKCELLFSSFLFSTHASDRCRCGDQMFCHVHLHGNPSTSVTHALWHPFRPSDRSGNRRALDRRLLVPSIAATLQQTRLFGSAITVEPVKGKVADACPPEDEADQSARDGSETGEHDLDHRVCEPQTGGL